MGGRESGRWKGGRGRTILCGANGITRRVMNTVLPQTTSQPPLPPWPPTRCAWGPCALPFRLAPPRRGADIRFAASHPPPPRRGERTIAGGAARLGEREPPDPRLTNNASTPTAPWRGARSALGPNRPPLTSPRPRTPPTGARISYSPNSPSAYEHLSHPRSPHLPNASRARSEGADHPVWGERITRRVMNTVPAPWRGARSVPPLSRPPLNSSRPRTPPTGARISYSPNSPSAHGHLPHPRSPPWQYRMNHSPSDAVAPRLPPMPEASQPIARGKVSPACGTNAPLVVQRRRLTQGRILEGCQRRALGLTSPG
ncbi:hypothetical protein HNQ64_002964 [Prosthecobacter dejongeii]|uniref:Uncharacterized protein n=1 Tax=Prosthecobacter dejongeii TaxID=48465 RepID=A0A7W7YM08_9BACT|nr:hypothetical protein [Prosthecobacter dejongeii]